MSVFEEYGAFNTSVFNSVFKVIPIFVNILGKFCSVANLLFNSLTEDMGSYSLPEKNVHPHLMARVNISQ